MRIAYSLTVSKRGWQETLEIYQYEADDYRLFHGENKLDTFSEFNEALRGADSYLKNHIGECEIVDETLYSGERYEPMYMQTPENQ